MKRKGLYWAAMLALLGCAAFLGGCQSRQPYAGKYQSLNHPEGQSPIVLELKATGEGIWSAGDQRIPFRWEFKQEKIWLHTQGGGVLIATPMGDELSVDMSGDLHPGCPPTRCLNFKRLPEGA